MLRKFILAITVLLLLVACGDSDDDGADITQELGGFEAIEGFIDLYWDEKGGRLILKVDRFGEPFIYQSSLARGIGSNDLGLDRGQLGDTRVVAFLRSGPKVLLVEENTRFRADGGDQHENRAVAESFATSVVWGFKVLGESDGAVYVDATDFVTRDAHGIAAQLKAAKEGEYKVDASRSMIYLPRTRAFPDNSEMEAMVTLVGKPEGKILPSVAPDPSAITVHMHHSFVRLPDAGYQPLIFDPRAGLIGLSFGHSGFLDFSTAIGEPLARDFARRHRLAKVDSDERRSEALEPIIYYLDQAAPEPLRSAIMEGASWWQEAFEAAGYKDAFQVKLLPDDVDPMDVRYNVIQWVHRATRGWSYGYSVVDPRTGEIIKGHVSLGSSRVRQDYLLAEGLLAPYADEKIPNTMLDMSLARIRQLAAHEVGHTLGLAHNLAASTQGRSSVMDYPFPLIRFDDAGELDLSDAYGVGIGGWDKQIIAYAYQDFAVPEESARLRVEILAKTLTKYNFVADEHARDVGSAHPDGNMWDNGGDAIAELRHLLKVRAFAMRRFSQNNIRFGAPQATLEEVLVPLYLLHRYQIPAVGKLIGGQYYRYSVRGDRQQTVRFVTPSRQRQAIQALLNAISPASLKLPAAVVKQLPPRPPGLATTRELFSNETGQVFDPLGPADSAIALTLDVLLNPQRVSRMIVQNATNPTLPGFVELCDTLIGKTWYAPRQPGMDGLIQRRSATRVLQRLMQFSVAAATSAEASAISMDALRSLDGWLAKSVAREPDPSWHAHFARAHQEIVNFLDDPMKLRKIAPIVVPAGSPIGGE